MAVVVRTQVCFAGCDALYGIHHSGFSSNLLEVGGEDTALINAVSNTLTNLPGFVVPLLGVALRRLSGSLLPLFVCASAFLLATGGAFVSTGSFALPVPLHLCAEQPPLVVVVTAGGVGFGAAGARAAGGARRTETTGAI